MKNSALLVNLCFTGILTTSCFHCLCVILAPRYWQFHVFIVFKMTMSLNLLYFVSYIFEFFTIIKMGIINDLCIPHFSIIFYFVTVRYWQYHVIIVFEWWCDKIWSFLSIDSNFSKINQISKNVLILFMTPEKQDKTLELSKHWSPDSTPARNEVMKMTYPVNQ